MMDTMVAPSETVEKHSLDVQSCENAHLLPNDVDEPAVKPTTYMMHLGCALTVVNIIIFLSLVALTWHSWVTNTKCDCSERVLSTYSPIYERLSIDTSSHHFNNTFWPDGFMPSIYQRAPSPEVDEAWARISDTHAFRLTHGEVVKMGKDPNTLWPWPQEDTASQGTPEYMGMVDFFHQAHCLDNLRRAAFPSYYNISAIRESYAKHPFPFDDHLLHCQFVLLEALMCHADVEVVTYNKVRGVNGPFANFAVDRTCRNFDDLLEWKENNSVVEVPGGWDKFWTETPEGIVEMEPWDTKATG